jgi:flagellar basal body rod protein FlgC
MWQGFFFALTALICLGSTAATLYVAFAAKADWESLQRAVRSNASAIRSIEVTLQEHSDTLLEVANSVKMTKVRKALTHTKSKSEPPDPTADPEGWRAWMNGQLRLGRGGDA